MASVVLYRLQPDVRNVNTTGTDFSFYLQQIGHPLTVSLPQVVVVQRGPTGAYYLYQIHPDFLLLASTLSSGALPAWTFLARVSAMVDSIWANGKATGIPFFERLVKRGRVQDLAQYMGGSYTIREFVGLMLSFIMAYEVLAWTAIWTDSMGWNFNVLENARTMTSLLANNTQLITVSMKDISGVYPSNKEIEDVLNAAFGKAIAGLTTEIQTRIVKFTSIFRTPCTNLAYAASIQTEVAKQSRHLYFEAFDIGAYNAASSPEFMRHNTVSLIRNYFLSGVGGKEFLDLLSVVSRAFGLPVASRVVMVYHGGDKTQPNHLHVEFTPRQSLFAAKFKYRPGV